MQSYSYRKKIFILKKGEVVSQIPCSTSSFENTRFKASSQSRIDVDESSKEEDIDNSDIYSSNEESDEN